MENIVDEIQKIEKRVVEFSRVALNHKKKVYLILANLVDYNESKERKYLYNLFFQVGNEIVTKNIADSVLFKEELQIFNLKNVGSEFFENTSKKEITTVKIKVENNDENVYLSRADANAILTMWRMSLSGISFSKLSSSDINYDYSTWEKDLIRKNYITE